MFEHTISELGGRLAKYRRVVLVVALAVSVPLAALFAVRSVVRIAPPTRAFSFAALSDWYTSAEEPARTFNGRWLKTSRSRRHHEQAYLRFRLDGLTGTVTRATLRVYAASANRGGFLVAAVPSSAWTGHATPYRNALPLGPVVGNSGPINRPGWVAADLDLSPVHGEPVLVALVAASTASARYASGETGQTGPRLVIETTDGRAAAPRPAPAAAPGGAVRVVAAGDVACDQTRPADPEEGPTVGPSCGQRATADLALSLHPDAVLPLGDLAYPNGTLAAYRRSYQPAWGRLDRISHPVPGNHEYITSAESVDAAGYHAYFRSSAGGALQGWYSFDLGRWHLIALNGECRAVGGCGPGSPQERWLRADLAAHGEAACVLAYWHQPRFSSGRHGGDKAYGAFWEDLYRAGAEVVLNGHDHDYERFAPQAPDGRADPDHGIREFVVGTGGVGLRQFRALQPNSETRHNSGFGVLLLELHPNGYAWRFVATAGGSFGDSGSGTCH
ncbi:MAG TPA: DNRLRE domain-containing protein [Actinomycetes bacterium]